MSQFVQQKRDEEQDCRRHGQAQDKAIAPLRIAGMKLGGKRKHNQEGDEKPAIVQPNFDSKDSSELDLRSQPRYLLRSVRRARLGTAIELPVTGSRQSIPPSARS